MNTNKIMLICLLILSININYAQNNKSDDSLNLSIMLYESGKTQKAIEQIEKLIQNSQDYMQAYTKLGIIYCENKQYDKGIELFKKASELSPNDKTVLSNLGNAYTDIQRYSEAIEIHNKIIEFDPSDSKTYLNLGVAYLKSGNTEEGIKLFKKAISINQFDPWANYNLGYTYYTMKKWPEAIDALIITRKIDEWHPGVEEGLRLLFNEAYSDLKKGVQENPSEPMQHYYLALAYMYKGNWEEAENEIDNAIKLDETKAMFYSAKSLIYLSQGKYDVAELSCKQCIDKDNMYWPCYGSLAGIYTGILDKPKKAIDLLTKIIQNYPEIISLHEQLGIAYYLAGDYEKANIAFMKAISLGSDDEKTYYNIAAAYFELKRYDLSWRYLRIAENHGYPTKDPLFKSFLKSLKEVSREPE